LATAGDTLYKIWDTTTWKKLHSAKSSQVICAAFSPDGKMLATGHSDHAIRLWEVNTANLQHALPAGNEKVSSVQFTPNGRLLISGIAAKLVRGWNTSDWKEAFSWPAHDTAIT